MTEVFHGQGNRLLVSTPACVAIRLGDTYVAGLYRSFNPSLRLFAKRHNLLLNQYGLIPSGLEAAPRRHQLPHDLSPPAVAHAALDDAARDDAALDHDLRAGRDAGHHLLGALRITRVCGQHRPCGCAARYSALHWILMVRKSSRYYLE